jgi:hypothetical protein
MELSPPAPPVPVPPGTAPPAPIVTVLVPGDISNVLSVTPPPPPPPPTSYPAPPPPPTSNTSTDSELITFIEVVVRVIVLVVNPPPQAFVASTLTSNVPATVGVPVMLTVVPTIVADSPVAPVPLITALANDVADDTVNDPV